MLPQFLIPLKLFIVSLLAVYQGNNPYVCPTQLETLDDYESCYLKANHDYNFCLTEQMDGLESCHTFAQQIKRISFINQPGLTSLINIPAQLLASSCNSLCKKPYNYDWPCLDQQRDKERAWLDMRFFETDKRTKKQRKEELVLFLAFWDQVAVLERAHDFLQRADPSIYSRTIPQGMTPEELACIRIKVYQKDHPCMSSEEIGKAWKRDSERNSYVHTKMITDEIEAMIKYWHLHTDFAHYIRPESPILSKKDTKQCMKAFIDSLWFQDYLAKRKTVMQEAQRRELRPKAVVIYQKQATKHKKKITRQSRKPVYFMGATPKPFNSQQSYKSKNKTQYKLAHR